MRFVPVVLCAAALAAQGPMFVVDASGGPGTNYMDIQAAVVAVPDGSTLIVRPGTYSPVLIDGKGMTILCDAGVTASSAAANASFLTIRNTLPAQIVTVRRLACGTANGLLIDQALGPVTFDAAGLAIQLGWSWASFRVTASAQVAIMNLTAGWAGGFAGRVEDSVAVFENCTFRGANAVPISTTGVWPAYPGLQVVNSHVELTHTSVIGGNDLSFVDPIYSQVWYGPPGPAVMMDGGTLRVTGGPSHPLTGGLRQYTSFPPTGPSTALVSWWTLGVARVDPLVPVSGNPPAYGVTLTRPTLPGLTTTSAPPGGSLLASRRGAPSVLCALLISLRGPSITVPGLPDPIWLDPANWFVESVATTPASGPWVVQKPVPNHPALRGLQLCWQAVDVTATGLVPSNPSPSFVH